MKVYVLKSRYVFRDDYDSFVEGKNHLVFTDEVQAIETRDYLNRIKDAGYEYYDKMWETVPHSVEWSVFADDILSEYNEFMFPVVLENVADKNTGFLLEEIELI